MKKRKGVKKKFNLLRGKIKARFIAIGRGDFGRKANRYYRRFGEKHGYE